MKIKLLILFASLLLIPQALAGELNFDDVNTAESETYYCAEGESCVISCSGVQSCGGSTFYCANNYDLTLNCSGNQSCGHSNIYDPEDRKFTLNFADGTYPIWPSRLDEMKRVY